jgi:hypothetical protein
MSVAMRTVNFFQRWRPINSLPSALQMGADDVESREVLLRPTNNVEYSNWGHDAPRVFHSVSLVPQSQLYKNGNEMYPERDKPDFRRWYSAHMVAAFNTFETYAQFCRCCIELPLSDNGFSTYVVCCVTNNELQKGHVKPDEFDKPFLLSPLSCLDFCPWATSKPQTAPTSQVLNDKQILQFTEEDVIFYEGYNNVVRYACCCCPCTFGIPIPITKNQFDCYQNTHCDCANLGCLGVCTACTACCGVCTTCCVSDLVQS